jgi:hypothetical protein
MCRIWKAVVQAAIILAFAASSANASDSPFKNSLVERISSLSPVDIAPEQPQLLTPLASPDPLDQAQSVPKVLAQGLTLYHDAIEGKKIQRTSFIGSLQTEDFAGRPFTYLNFAIPMPRQDILSLSPNALDQLDSSKVSTTVTGASTARSVAYAKADDIQLLKEILLTTAALGGSQNVKRIVSLQGYFDIYLESLDGQVWIVSSSPKIASPEQVDQWRAQERQMHQSLKSEATYYAKLEQQWHQFLRPANNAKASSESSRMDSFTLADGSLDIAQAVQLTSDRGVHLLETRPADEKAMAKVVTASRQDYCWPFLWWTVCDWSTYGELSNNHVAGGKYQSAWMYGMPNWNVSGNDVLGCGPAAFISMTWWWWRYKGVEFYNRPPNLLEEPIYYRANFNGNDQDYVLPNKLGDKFQPVWASNSIASLMVQPVNSFGRPQIADFLLPYAMGPFSTATNPWDLHAGGQRFLDNQRARFNLKDMEKVGGKLSMNSKWISSLVGVIPIIGAVSATDYVYSIGSIINEHVGVRDNVVLALYPTAADIVGGPHYSPILKYRIIWGNIQQAWITPVDDPSVFRANQSAFSIFTLPFNSNRQYNMATPEGLAKGVFYFEAISAANPIRQPRDN